MIYFSSNIKNMIEENAGRDYRLSVLKAIFNLDVESAGLDPSVKIKAGDSIQILNTVQNNLTSEVENSSVSSRNELLKMNMEITDIHTFIYYSEGGNNMRCEIIRGFDALTSLRDINSEELVCIVTRMTASDKFTVWNLFGPVDNRTIKDAEKKCLEAELGYNL